MKHFLKHPEAAFYHVCALHKLDNILAKGLKGKHGKIFVSNIDNKPILAAIAAEQIPDIYESTGFAVLKLPQKSNNFRADEIFEDNQAGVERTKVFQNIIKRSLIPQDCIELLFQYEFDTEGLDKMTKLAAQANAYKSEDEIYRRAMALKVNKEPDINIDPYWL